MKVTMKNYRHKKDGYEVHAGRYMKTYRVYGYPSFPACIYLAVGDFEALFEPSPETPGLAGSFPADLPQAQEEDL